MREWLDNIVEMHDLIGRTFESFWYTYDKYLEEEPEESKKTGLSDRGSINAELYGYAFCVTNELDFDCICISNFISKEKMSAAVSIGAYTA